MESGSKEKAGFNQHGGRHYRDLAWKQMRHWISGKFFRQALMRTTYSRGTATWCFLIADISFIYLLNIVGIFKTFFSSGSHQREMSSRSSSRGSSRSRSPHERARKWRRWWEICYNMEGAGHKSSWSWRSTKRKLKLDRFINTRKKVYFIVSLMGFLAVVHGQTPYWLLLLQQFYRSVEWSGAEAVIKLLMLRLLGKKHLKKCTLSCSWCSMNSALSMLQ